MSETEGDQLGVSGAICDTGYIYESMGGVDDPSPLWLLGSVVHLDRFVRYLQQVKEQLDLDPEAAITIRVSREDLRKVREEFVMMMRSGEERLHRLGLLLSSTLLETFHLHSLVIGEVMTTKERFTLMQTVQPQTLFATMDIDLGNAQLSKLLFFDGTQWSKTSLVSNVVEYVANEVNNHGIHRILTRVKAEQEIWNKVVDEIFELDALVRTDKQLLHLSRFVKDVFGIKIVVGTVDEARAVHEVISNLNWSKETLSTHKVDHIKGAEQLCFLETKEHLTEGTAKSSGWQAVKSVVRWGGRTFEIQIQPLRNYLAEKERLTTESHVGFKARRELIRDEVAKSIPLFGFYRELLRWLFIKDTSGEVTQPPGYRNVSVVIE